MRDERCRVERKRRDGDKGVSSWELAVRMDVGDLSNVAAGLAGNGGAASAAILGPPAGHLPAAGILSGGGGGGGGGGVSSTIIPTTATSAGWWTPTSTIVTAPANTDVMNQLCRVCGEPAAGFHFGAFTCEGCKSFFGRTYNNLGSISECKNGGACIINKKNRTACKACRLRKCLMVGMSKSGSRYGRRSNWFKIHCLLQEQSHQAQARLKDPKSPFEKVLSSLDAANNNSSSNNGGNPGSGLPSVAGGNNSYQGRLPKLEDPRLRPQDLASLRSQQDSPRPQLVTRPSDLMAAPHELLRPEASRFPMWRGPPFFHPALSPMHLLNSPFFPFQQRFVVPYVNQVGASQIPVTSLSSSSSSESVSPRSTPSPKREPDDVVDGPRDEDDSLRSSRVDHSVLAPNESQTSGVSQEKSLAFLRSLGPEQDEPMDLSAKNTAAITKNRDRRAEQSTSSGDDVTEERTEEGCTDGEENETSDTEAAPPLDLTRKT